MIAEAIETIARMAKVEILSAHGKSYSINELVPLPSPHAMADPLKLHTLGGLVEYVKADFDKVKACALFVVDSKKVSLMFPLVGDFRQREEIAVAQPFDGARHAFGRWQSLEDFMIDLQTHFVRDEAVNQILAVMGSVHTEAAVTVGDDGVSQQVTARTGVARLGTADIPNPVLLAPYRTFADIYQPTSPFILRMRRQDDGAPEVALFETGDHQWQLTATKDIAAFLKEAGLPVFA